FGVAGLAHVLGTPRARLGTRTWPGKPPASPNRSQVRSLETTWLSTFATHGKMHIALSTSIQGVEHERDCLQGREQTHEHHAAACHNKGRYCRSVATSVGQDC